MTRITLVFWSLIAVTLLPLDLMAQDEPAAEQAAGDADESTVADPVGYFLGLSVGQQMRQNGFRPGDFDLQAMLAGFQDGMQEREAALSDEVLQETQRKIQELVQERRREMIAESRREGEAFLAANLEQEGVQELRGGVQYKVLKEGTGESPEPTDTVKVHYTGKLIDGTMFDSSVQRGEPATFRVNGVIEGWQIALQEMKVGSKWMLYIPSDKAYGEGGSPRGGIGPNQVLVFEVELLEIQ